MFNVMLKQHQFIQADARWLNEMQVVFFCSWSPFLSQISLLGIETITSALEHHVYLLTLTQLHPHGWSGVCLALQRYARCKHASGNKLSMCFSKPLCCTWNHGHDTGMEGKKSLSNISVHHIQADEGHHVPLQLLHTRLGLAPVLPRPVLPGRVAGGRAPVLDSRRDAGLESRCPLTPSPSLLKLGEVMTLSPGLLLFAAVLWDTALHIHQVRRCRATLLDWASSPNRHHPQGGCQQDRIQRWIFSSRLPP